MNWEGWPKHEGPLIFDKRAAADIMRKRGMTEDDVRMVLANPSKEHPSDKEPGRWVTEGIGPDGQMYRVVTSVDDTGVLHCTTAFPLDAKPVWVQVPADRAGRLIGVKGWRIKRIRGLGAEIAVFDKKNGAKKVRIISPFYLLAKDAEREVKEIADGGKA
jgi:hypothetical protein